MAECHWTGPRLPAIPRHLVADCQCHQPHHLGWASADASCNAGSGGGGRCPADPADLMDSDKRTRGLGPSRLADDCDERMCPSHLADDCDERMCPSHLADDCDERMCPSHLADDCDERMCPSHLADDCDERMCPSRLADGCDGRMGASRLADDDGFWYSKARIEISKELFNALYTN